MKPLKQTKGNKVQIEWNTNHIGFNGGSAHETYRGVKSEKAARDIIGKRNANAMRRATYVEQLPDGKVNEIDLLTPPNK